MKHKWLAGIHLLILVLLYILAFTTNGTGGGGDSLTHFFFAQLAWEEPINFFDHWGKPFFTFFASPFAQLGFTGIKIFNITCGVAASYFASLVALRLGKSWHFTIPLIAFIAPAYYTFLFSGLTEPFSSLVVIASVYLCVSGRVSAGFLLASFLPFCRSEAQIFLLFFALYGMTNGHWKKLPLLISGYVIYGLIGSIYMGSIFWVFQVPYNAHGSVYGNGEWWHYLDQLQSMLAIPGISLAGLGLIQILRNIINGKFGWKKEMWLVHGIFFSLLFGHSLVWALGIYGSAGLSRTLLTVFPLLWIIMLDGLILLKDLSSRLFKGQSYILPAVFLILQIINTATRPISKYYYYAHLTLNDDDNYINNEIGPFIEQNFPGTEHYVIDKPYLAVALDINFIDPRQRSNWSIYTHLEDLEEDALLIFDSQYVPVQYGINKEQLENEGKLIKIKEWSSPLQTEYILFKRASD